jgi:hypothetical protein
MKWCLSYKARLDTSYSVGLYAVIENLFRSCRFGEPIALLSYEA